MISHKRLQYVEEEKKEPGKKMRKPPEKEAPSCSPVRSIRFRLKPLSMIRNSPFFVKGRNSCCERESFCDGGRKKGERKTEEGKTFFIAFAA